MIRWTYHNIGSNPRKMLNNNRLSHREFNSISIRFKARVVWIRSFFFYLERKKGLLNIMTPFSLNFEIQKILKSTLITYKWWLPFNVLYISFKIQIIFFWLKLKIVELFKSRPVSISLCLYHPLLNIFMAIETNLNDDWYETMVWWWWNHFGWVTLSTPIIFKKINSNDRKQKKRQSEIEKRVFIFIFIFVSL